MPPSLGTAFWGNFFLLDNEHTEAMLQSHLHCDVQLQLEPTDSVAIDVVRQNCVTAKESLRRVGFRVPTSAGKRVICMWCWTSKSCNSTSLQAHLVTCAVCPESVKSKYGAVTTGKSAASHFGATQLAAAKAAQRTTVQCNKAQKRECDAVAVAASSEVSDAELAALTAAARHLRQARYT